MQMFIAEMKEPAFTQTITRSHTQLDISIQDSMHVQSQTHPCHGDTLTPV